MSLRGFGLAGKAGSDDGHSSAHGSGGVGGAGALGPTSLLNTPLANTMKKVGMNPNLANNRLNQFLVKKGPANNNGSNNAFSH